MAESRKPLKPVLGGMRIVAFPIILMNRFNKPESAVVVFLWFFLNIEVLSVSKGSVFPAMCLYGEATCLIFCNVFVKVVFFLQRNS